MSASARQFARHYAEMVVAMFLGMIVLGAPLFAALGAAGVSSSELHNDLPTVMFLSMAVTMTVPMVGWMRHRGHGWPASIEMAASMFLPTFVAIALLPAGIAMNTLLVGEHVAMLAAMFGAMLLRRDEYAHGDHAHAEAVA